MEGAVSSRPGARAASRGSPPGEGGAALVAAVVLGVALTLLGHAALVLGGTMARAAQIDQEATERDAAMMRSLAAAIGGMDSLHLESGDAQLRGHRLSAEILLLVAADSTGGRAGAVWAPDPATRVGSLAAGVVTGTTPSFSTRARIEQEVETGADCPEGGLTGGVAPWASLGGPDSIALAFGPVEGHRWRARIEPSGAEPGGAGAAEIEGEGAPAAVWWGGDAVLNDTLRNVMLWVDGELQLGPGALLEGWVALTGDLHMEAESRIRGVVRAGGALRMHETARIRVARCPLARLLDRVDQLRAPHALAPFGWRIDGIR